MARTLIDSMLIYAMGIVTGIVFWCLVRYVYDQRKETLDRIYRQIEKVHIDFRDDINQTYSDMSGKINALFLNFEEGLIKHGRTI